MIIKDNKESVVSSKNGLGNVIKYHHDKVLQKEAIVYDGFASLDMVHKLGNLYLEDLEQNNSLANKPIYHVPISFHPDDKLTNLEKSEIVRDYLELKKVNPTSVCVVEHFDKAHPHLHIIFLNRTNENKYNVEFTKFGSIRDTKAFCRATEISRNLHIIEGDKTKMQNYKESKALEYSLIQAISKNKEHPLIIDFINDSVGKKDFINKVLDKKMSNNEIKSLNENYFFGLYNLLKQENLLYQSRAKRVEELIKKNISEITKDPYNFEHPELYVRVMKGKYLKYGLISESYYINENKLPKTFSLNFIKGKEEYTRKNSIDFIRNNINPIMKNAKNFDQMKVLLLDKGISMEILENASGPFGIRFKHKDNEIKATDVSKELSYKKLNDYFDKIKQTMPVSTTITHNDVEIDNSEDSSINIQSSKGNTNSDIDDIVRRKGKSKNL